MPLWKLIVRNNPDNLDPNCCNLPPLPTYFAFQNNFLSLKWEKDSKKTCHAPPKKNNNNNNKTISQEECIYNSGGSRTLKPSNFNEITGPRVRYTAIWARHQNHVLGEISRDILQDIRWPPSNISQTQKRQISRPLSTTISNGCRGGVPSHHSAKFSILF
jgi:hypothetical protein